MGRNAHVPTARSKDIPVLAEMSEPKHGQECPCSHQPEQGHSCPCKSSYCSAPPDQALRAWNLGDVAGSWVRHSSKPQ